MTPSLQTETEKLTRSWMQHEADWLRNYLVSTVEDPRINLQSIFTRHFLIRELLGEGFGPLMREEYRFSAAMNWLKNLAKGKAGPEDHEALQFALYRQADNAEGIEIPAWFGKIFRSIPAEANGAVVSNYIERYLNAGKQNSVEGCPAGNEVLNEFAGLWSAVLPCKPGSNTAAVLEPACGSANDYRFLQAYGITRLMDYTGFDLCHKNVENAKLLFPDARFESGNVFAIEAGDQVFDFCIVHDLFEHLSPEGLEAAVKETCRVTRRSMCIGFFQMDEIPEHVQRPMEEYYWNLLSMDRMKEAFAKQGFKGQAIHIGTFLKQNTGCDETHNREAYTFVLTRAN